MPSAGHLSALAEADVTPPMRIEDLEKVVTVVY